MHTDVIRVFFSMQKLRFPSKNMNRPPLTCQDVFLWWKCVFQMLEYLQCSLGNTGQYLATLGNTVSQMPRYCWARQGIPQITCSLSLASATIYTGIVSPLVFVGLASGDQGQQNGQFFLAQSQQDRIYNIGECVIVQRDKFDRWELIHLGTYILAKSYTGI